MFEDKDMYLMMKDKPVMLINFAIGKYDVLNEKLLPFQLQNCLHVVPTFDEIKT